MVELVPFKMGTRQLPCLFFPCGDTVRKCQSMDLETGSHKILNLLVP
jgi:hypothetical protein